MTKPGAGQTLPGHRGEPQGRRPLPQYTAPEDGRPLERHYPTIKVPRSIDTAIPWTTREVDVAPTQPCGPGCGVNPWWAERRPWQPVGRAAGGS